MIIKLHWKLRIWHQEGNYLSITYSHRLIPPLITSCLSRPSCEAAAVFELLSAVSISMSDTSLFKVISILPPFPAGAQQGSTHALITATFFHCKSNLIVSFSLSFLSYFSNAKLYRNLCFVNSFGMYYLSISSLLLFSRGEIVIKFKSLREPRAHLLFCK